MNRTFYILLLLALFPQTLYSLSRTRQCIQKIKSFFYRYPVERVTHKEFPMHAIQTLNITNYSGPVTIKTGWKKDSLCLKTTKRAKSLAHLNDLNTIIDATTKQSLSVTGKTSDISSGIIEYELIIPLNIAIHVTTHNGTITINDTHGTIVATTQEGNITIVNTKNNITAQTRTGSILVENAEGIISAQSHAGTIMLNEVSNTVDASTQKGKITVCYKHLPLSSNVSLKTECGTIACTIPHDSHAMLNASTVHGTIISEHYVTLKPYTTQLNTLAWNTLKKKIQGTIGDGNALICCSSTYGNIKILEKNQKPTVNTVQL